MSRRAHRRRGDGGRCTRPVNIQRALNETWLQASSLPATVAGHTQIVLLGTGTPRADPQRSGPATAVVVNGTPYLVDAGPGIVQRAAAAYDKGVKGLAVANLQTVFITHLHSDHTVGYPDLIFTTLGARPK
jgi:phosphoribosyl 1,2-cyclic phosphodiesterase